MPPTTQTPCATKPNGHYPNALAAGLQKSEKFEISWNSPTTPGG
jgi:hypothetical protein